MVEMEVKEQVVPSVIERCWCLPQRLILLTLDYFLLSLNCLAGD